jgi:hypothetical protein
MSEVIKNFAERKLEIFDQRHSHLLLIARLREEYEDQMAKYIHQFITQKPRMDKVYAVARYALLNAPYDEFTLPCINVLEEIIDNEDAYADEVKVQDHFEWMVRNNLASPINESFIQSSGDVK